MRKIATENLIINDVNEEILRALQIEAKQRGVSLNAHILKIFEKDIEARCNAKRLMTMKTFLKSHHISPEDARAVREAVAWSKQTSIEKQKREEHEREKY